MYEVIGERLKSLREERNLSQSGLAKLCGWPTASRVGNYEIGSRKIGVDDAIVLANALGTTPSHILFGDEGSPDNWLSDSQRQLLKTFRQLPEDDQQKFITMMNVRLKEIDDFIEKYKATRLRDNDN